MEEKNGQDPWISIFGELWLRTLCYDFEGVRRLSKTVMRSEAGQHASWIRTVSRISSGQAELYQGNLDKALQCFSQVRDPRITPNFILHWRWRLHAQLAVSETQLQAGDISDAHREADDVLASALAVADPNLSACTVIAAQRIQPADLWKRPVAAADRKLAYGRDALQFGELRLPKTKGPYPAVILVHGGCWVDRLPGRDPRDTTFEPLRPLAEALADAGVATWNIEYRRAGKPGGGWPGSFLDLAAGVDFLRTIARANQLDLNRVVVLGHSSGGQLVHWIAARPKLPRSSPLYSKNPLRLKAVVNVDGLPDLAAAQPLEKKFCPVPAITQFMGGTASRTARTLQRDLGRGPAADPIPQTIVAGGLLQGAYDLVSTYEASATAKGDSVTILKLEGAGHFDMLAPEGQYGKSVIEAILALLG